MYVASAPGSTIYDIRQGQINALVQATAGLEDKASEADRRLMIEYLAEIINSLLRTPPVQLDYPEQVAEIQRVVRGYIKETIPD